MASSFRKANVDRPTLTTNGSPPGIPRAKTDTHSPGRNPISSSWLARSGASADGEICRTRHVVFKEASARFIADEPLNEARKLKGVVNDGFHGPCVGDGGQAFANSNVEIERLPLIVHHQEG